MTDFDKPFEKRLEKRLADAMSAREQQIEVDPDAWQTHLDLVQAQSGNASGRPAVVGRWRAPALVAASVVAVGLIGGIVAQSGLLGSHPVSPAGPDSGVAAPVSTEPGSSQDSGPGTPNSVGADGGGRQAPPRSTVPAAPRSSGRAVRPTVPISARSTTPAVTSEEPPEAVAQTVSRTPRETTGHAPSPPAVTSTVADGIDHAAGGDAAGSGPQATTMIDLSDLMRCGAQLPDLSKITTAVTVEAGPTGDIVNSSKQALPVLAVGYAVVGGDGRIASAMGGETKLQKTTASTLPGGRSARTDEPSILPTGLCAWTSGPNATTAIQQHIGEPATNTAGSLIFQVGLQGGLPPGTYSAVDVVLVGADLAHAMAYRTGPVWQFTTG